MLIDQGHLNSIESCREHLEYPLITIALTCFNAEDTIERAIDSALSQTWPNKEILVVDDCSSDKSIAIINKIADQHSIIKVLLNEKNNGTAASRNRLIENATGEFVAFFDDDDESAPERVQVQYKRILEYEVKCKGCLIACYAPGNRVYPNGYTLNLEAIGSRGVVPKGALVANYILFNERVADVFYGTGTPTCSLMARTNVFRQLDGFDQEFRRVEDMDFAVRLALRGGHFIGCSELLFTQYATQGSDKSAASNFKAENKLLDKHQKYLEKLNRYRYAKNWFLVRYCHFSGDHLGMLRALIIAWFQNPVLITRHFLSSAPRRLLHEIKMNSQKGDVS